jgi:CRP-like cAMP-binding protein
MATTTLELDDPILVVRLGSAARARLAAVARIVDLEPGDIPVREGQPTPFLGLIQAGRVALRVHVPHRGPTTLVTIETGELVGWSSVVAPYRSFADVAALAPTRLIAFDAEPLRRLIAEDSAVAADLLPWVLESVAHRLSASWVQMLDLFGGEVVEPW